MVVVRQLRPVVYPDKNGNLKGQRDDQEYPRQEPDHHRPPDLPDFLRLEYGDNYGDAAQKKVEYRGIEEPAEMLFHAGPDKSEQVVQVACYGNKKQ